MRRRRLLGVLAGPASLGGCLRLADDEETASSSPTSGARGTTDGGTAEPTKTTAESTHSATETVANRLVLETRWLAQAGGTAMLLRPDAVLTAGGREMARLARDDGSVEWRWRLDADDESYNLISVAARDGVVCGGSFYAGSGDQPAKVHLVTDRGEHRWTRTASEPRLTNPVVAADVVVVGYRPTNTSGGEGVVTALDRSTGEVSWTIDAHPGILRRLALHDGRLYVTSTEGISAYSFDGSGRTLENRAAVEGPVADATIRDDTVYASVLGGPVRAIATPSLSVRWTSATSFDRPSRPLGTPAAVFVGDESEFVALDPGSGETRWVSRLDGHGELQPVTTADHVWAATAGPSEGSTLHGFERATGTPVFRRQRDDTWSMAATDRTLYLGHVGVTAAGVREG